ncbi:hypothetical protein LZC95_47000 [Pendulispora brunnea]|uniref:DUF4388 domain-containing protein n=1 Tax=Pendulispora brunnea TaxID=2905690 RepID=A0ABZ2K5L5_9BACT
MSTSADPVATLREFVRAKRTGTLVVREGERVAELRLALGNIEDAIFLDATGEKALYRALALPGATWSFEHRTTGTRRIRTPTEQILNAVPRVLLELERLREAFPDAHERPLLAVETDPGVPLTMSTSARALLVHLRGPILLDALLDRVPASDVEILSAVSELKQSGRVRVLASPKERVPLGTDEELASVARSIEQQKRLRIGSAVRLVFAGAPHRLAVISHAISCLEGAAASPHGVPPIPMPATVAFVPIHGAMQLDVTTCPLVPAYAPLWPMAMKGSFAVVRIDEAAEHLVDQACETAGLRPLDARNLLPDHDPVKVGDVAQLLLRALRT